MSHEHPGIDHAVVNRDYHAAHIRIVPTEELDAAMTDMKFLFPHDVIVTNPLGCRHVCLFTDKAPASLVAECLDLHLREVEHRRSRIAP